MPIDSTTTSRPDFISHNPEPWKTPFHNHLPKHPAIQLLKAHQIAVLQAIANRCSRHPDHDGSIGPAFMSFDTIAKAAHCSRRTAIRHVKTLTTLSILKKTHIGGVNFSTGECLANGYVILAGE